MARHCHFRALLSNLRKILLHLVVKLLKISLLLVRIFLCQIVDKSFEINLLFSAVKTLLFWQKYRPCRKIICDVIVVLSQGYRNRMVYSTGIIALWWLTHGHTFRQNSAINSSHVPLSFPTKIYDLYVIGNVITTYIYSREMESSMMKDCKRFEVEFYTEFPWWL